MSEPDVDALANLPLPVLLGWAEHFSLKYRDNPSPSSGANYVNPMAALGFFRQRYGGE